MDINLENKLIAFKDKALTTIENTSLYRQKGVVYLVVPKPKQKRKPKFKVKHKALSVKSTIKTRIARSNFKHRKK